MQLAQCPNQHIVIPHLYDPQNIRLLSIRILSEHAASIILAISVKDVSHAGVKLTPNVFARQVAMYLSHVTFGLTLTQTGALFARDRTTVAHGCGVVEDRRDNPALDRALDIADTALRRRLDRADRSRGVYE